MMVRYLDALRAGDIDAAMRERCAGAQVPQDQRGLFRTQTKQLIDMGRITGVEVAPRSTGRVRPLGESQDSAPFDYSIISDGGRSDGLHGVAVVEDGNYRLCGSSQPGVEQFTAELVDPGQMGNSPSLPIRELIPTSVGAGFTEVEDQAPPPGPDAAPGRVEAWTRAWQRGTYGGARVSAIRYETAALALGALDRRALDLAPNATELFAVDGLDKAVAFRYAGIAWSFVQPPEVGSQCDVVLMRFGDTVVAVGMCGLEPEEGHEVVSDLARAAAQLAG